MEYLTDEEIACEFAEDYEEHLKRFQEDKWRIDEPQIAPILSQYIMNAMGWARRDFQRACKESVTYKKALQIAIDYIESDDEWPTLSKNTIEEIKRIVGTLNNG